MYEESEKTNTFCVVGAGGHLTCDLTTGDVVECIALKSRNNAVSYKEIKRIDVRDLKKYLGPIPAKGSTVDILAVGVWLADGTYEPKIEIKEEE